MAALFLIAGLTAGVLLGVLAWFPALRSRILSAVNLGMLLSLCCLWLSYGLAVGLTGIWLAQGDRNGSAPSGGEAVCGWVFNCGLVALLALIVVWAVAQLRGLVHRPRTPARATAGIAILVGICIVLPPMMDPRIGTRFRESPVGRAKTQIQNIAQAIGEFWLSYKRLPEDLEELTRSPDRNPYPIIERIPADSWGRSYTFQHTAPPERGAPSLHCVISSNGPDGQPGTGDDIVYLWNPQHGEFVGD